MMPLGRCTPMCEPGSPAGSGMPSGRANSYRLVSRAAKRTAATRTWIRVCATPGDAGVVTDWVESSCDMVMRSPAQNNLQREVAVSSLSPLTLPYIWGLLACCRHDNLALHLAGHQ